MSEFTVDAARLRGEASGVRTVTVPLQQAQTAVADAGAAAGVAGHELVATGLASYTAWWNQAIAALVASADVIADQLIATADDYAAVDDRVGTLLSGTTPRPAGGTAPTALTDRLGGPR